MADLATVQAIESSNLPRSKKNALVSWFENKRAGIRAAGSRAKPHIEGGAESLRAGGEALVVGGIFGAIHTQFSGGLDVPLDKAGKWHLPIDAAAAVGGLVLSAYLTGQEEVYATDVRNAGTSAAAIFAFRMTNDYLSIKMREKGRLPGYQFSEKFGKVIGDPSAKETRKLAAEKGKSATAHGDYSGFGAEEDPVLMAGRRMRG